MSYVCQCANGKTWGAGNEGCNDNASNCAQCCSGGYGGVASSIASPGTYGSGTVGAFAQNQTAPAGYHYMPDGSLMSDADHVAELTPLLPRIINSFDLDLKNIKASGETRRFTVSGTSGSTFSLEVRSGSDYYNFQTNLFQATNTRLGNITISGGVYTGSIVFPVAAAGVQYDFNLTAEGKTNHVGYSEVRFADGSLDINSSTGSESKLLRKVGYQTLDTTLTLSHYSPTSVISASTTTDTIIGSRESSRERIKFEIKATVSAGALTIDRQPVDSDIMAFVTRTIGAAPVDIPGENIYPNITAYGDTNAVMSSTTTVTMAATIADLELKVGDKVIQAAGPYFANVVTVVATSGGGLSAYQFTASEAVSIGSGVRLNFYNRRNYKWPLNNIDLLNDGMLVISNAATNGFASNSEIKEYLDELTVFEGEKEEYKIEIKKEKSLDGLSVKPTITRDSTTKVVTTTQTGNIIFDQQALLTFAGTSAKIFSYGTDEVKRLTGYDITFSNLKAELNKVTTTTTSAVSSSTTIPVTSKVGIVDKTTQTVDGATIDSRDVVLDSVDGLGIGQSLYVGSGLVGTPTIKAINETTKKITLSTKQTLADGITLTFPNSIISGIGISNSVVNPYVNTISSLNLTASAAQTLEDAQTFTFTGAGDVVTITGYIKINNIGNEDVTLRFDVDKFLTQH